jgi:hypothetical protein
MKIHFIASLLFFSIVTGHAYSDLDVDGVDDAVDLCPNTPFDQLVEENGCSRMQHPKGVITLSAGVLHTVDQKSDNTSSLLFFGNYHYKKWDVSLSTFRTVDTARSLPDSYYLTSAYEVIHHDTYEMKVLGGVKLSSLQNDYYAGFSYTYTIQKDLSLFTYYSYAYAEDTAEQRYENYHTVSVGAQKSVNSRWHTTLSYDFSTASLPGTANYQAATLSNTLMLNDSHFILANYTYGLSESAAEHTFLLQYGVMF